MADAEYGISISQDGVPVDRAADYQKVLDSRWKFLEVLLEQTYKIELPFRAALAPGTVKAVDTFVTTHGLDDYPAYEATFTTSGMTENDIGYPDVIADKSSIYLRQIHSANDIIATTITLTVRVYNLAIFEEYLAPKELTTLTSGPESEIGFLSLDGTVPNLGASDQSSVGYSIDTKKKILSVHRTGRVEINTYLDYRLRATAINTTTDTFTFIDFSGSLLNPAGMGTDWVQTGVGIQYDPGDFVTYPAPLVFNGVYYIIRISATEFKLATTVANAQAGIAIDITSSGALPATVRKAFVTGTNVIKHDVGYPPTFLMARADRDTGVTYIGPLLDTILARVQATNTTITFLGIQSELSGVFGLVILKDPAEIAQ